MYRYLAFLSTAAGLLWSAASFAVAPAGIPDPAFGGVNAPPGFAIEEFAPGQGHEDTAFALVETNEGKLLLAGAAESDGPPCIGLMRFSADGVVDKNFGVQGKICHPLILGAEFQVQFADLNAVALADGKTLIGGNAIDTNLFAFVCRFQANGTKDLGFGTAQTPGCRVLPHTLSSPQKDIAPLVAANAKAIAVVTNPSAGDLPVLTRLSMLDGSLLPYGQANATPTLPPAAFPSATARDIAFTADGDLLVSGTGQRNGKFGAYVSRFDLDEGKPAPGFGDEGVRSIDFGNTHASANSIRVLASGRALIASVVQSPDGELAGLTQLSSATGAADPDFNDGDVSIVPLCDISLCDITELQIDRAENGKIFLAGALDILSTQSIFAARVNPDGSPDVPYGPSPELGVSVFESNTEARARMVLQGKNVVLGGTLALNQGSDFILVRLGDEDIFADSFDPTP